MDNIIILLIVVQAILTTAGYLYLSRELKRLREKIEKYTTIAFIVPIILGAFILGSKFPNMQLEQVTNFIYFLIISAVINTIEGTIIYLYEKTFLNGGRRY